MVTPFWSTTWKLGGAGIPKNWSKVCQIGAERGIDPFLDDGDRLAGTVAGDGGAAGAGEADLVDAVGVPKLRGGDLAAEERQLAGDRVRFRSRVGEREVVRSAHVLVGDCRRESPAVSAGGIGEEGGERGVDVRDPGTAAVERRVGHGQDEVVLRIDRDPAAVDVGDGRQTERRDERLRAASLVVEEIEPDRDVDRRGGTARAGRAAW